MPAPLLLVLCHVCILGGSETPPAIVVDLHTGADNNRWPLEEEEAWVGAAILLRAYKWPLETLLSFKYLGKLRTATEHDFPDVLDNLRKAIDNCYLITCIFFGRLQTLGN